MIILTDVLLQLDHWPSEPCYQIGLDWLKDNGYLLEASYYQWKTARNYEPELAQEHHHFPCLWHSPQNLTELLESGSAFQRAVIQETAIWQVLCHHRHIVWGGNRPFSLAYASRQAAVSDLRYAFLQVHQSL